MGHLINFINRRLHKTNNSFNCVFVGETGSGKSWAALSFAEEIDEDFDVNEQVVFDVGTFLKLINSDKVKRGSVIIFDEAGVAMFTREWRGLYNKAISLVFQTVRSRGYCIILCVPSFSFVDKHAREMMHCLMRLVKVKKTEKVSVIKPYLMQFNPMTGEIYYKFLRIGKKGSKKLIAVNKINVKKPSNKNIKIYERIKAKFQTKLYKDLEKKVEDTETKNVAKDTVFECIQCGHRWSNKWGSIPKQCPKCRTSYWNRQKEEISLGN